jgi:hypothetical protein
MSDLIKLYQKHCPYQITDHIQELEFTFDIERLRKELFKFIIDNKFGFSAVSLRLPQGMTNYISSDEMLETGGIDSTNYLKDENAPSNVTHNKEYSQWHPDLIDSYTSSLVSKIEKLCGLSIGRIRLGWLQPGHGYPMHCDLEPMRLHIPLFTNNLAYMIHDHNIYHMQYGKLYHLITTNIHTAWNFGKLPRLHLIFSTYADDEAEKEIDKLTQKKITKQNFLATIKNQGIDKDSLLMLLKIKESVEHIDSQTKLNILHEIKTIIDILSKNRPD